MSSDDIAIRVSNLSKCYQIYDTPRDRLKQFVFPRLQRVTGKTQRQYFREFWALKDISFEVKKGETVGIIGRNGSGKSTLLQMICGTLTPTDGSIKTNGRIAALLELGSGFNPEFTGRENVYMNAAVLGLSQEETKTRFEDIVSFADIGDFVEQPVKTYSSGMLVRLAFAVAINVEPEILIVDEALSVGDELFQRKCFSRIEAIRAKGATILFVSHSDAQIVELCDSAMLIDAGEKLLAGLPKQIVGLYQKLLYAPENIRDDVRKQIYHGERNKFPSACLFENSSAEMDALDTPVIELNESFDPDLKPTSSVDYESYGPIIGTPVILTLDGKKVNGLIRGRRYRYCYSVIFKHTALNVRFGMAIKTTTGLSICGALSAPSFKDSIPYIKEDNKIHVEFAFNCYLNPGIYFMNAGVFGCVGTDEILLHRRADVIAFRVLPIKSNLETEILHLNIMPKVSVDG